MHRSSLKGPRVPVATSNRPVEARERRRFIQAALPLLLTLAACEVPSQINLRSIGRDASGAALEARLPPPGMDRPTPNLASVPPVAQRPDLSLRSGVTSRLEEDRAASLAALPPRDAPAAAQPGRRVNPPQEPPRPPARRAAAERRARPRDPAPAATSRRCAARGRDAAPPAAPRPGSASAGPSPAGAAAPPAPRPTRRGRWRAGRAAPAPRRPPRSAAAGARLE